MTDSQPLESLTADDFRVAKGSKFELIMELAQTGRPAEFRLELADVSEVPGERSASFRKPFSVLFHGPVGPALPQGTYRLQHDQLGVLELFLVPLGPDQPPEPGESPSAMRYEAVFG